MRPVLELDLSRVDTLLQAGDRVARAGGRDRPSRRQGEDASRQDNRAAAVRPRHTLAPPRALTGAALNLKDPCYSSATHLFRSSPKPSIFTTASSPGFMKIGGLRAKPTPGGVPVETTSPGSSVITVLR